MKTHRIHFAVAVAISMLLAVTGEIHVYSQERMGDKDVEKMLNNLKSDTKKFKSAFNSGVEKSTIRNTSKEKEAKNLVETFGKQSEAALDKFKKDQKCDPEISSLISSGTQINQLLESTPMGDQTNAAWSTVKTELSDVAKQFFKEFPAK